MTCWESFVHQPWYPWYSVLQQKDLRKDGSKVHPFCWQSSSSFLLLPPTTTWNKNNSKNWMLWLLPRISMLSEEGNYWIFLSMIFWSVIFVKLKPVKFYPSMEYLLKVITSAVINLPLQEKSLMLKKESPKLSKLMKELVLSSSPPPRSWKEQA